ncbi:MAG: serine hydrolase [Pyrinomonadaceae bacterium]
MTAGFNSGLSGAENRNIPSVQTLAKPLAGHPWLWTKYAPPDKAEDIGEPSKYELNFNGDGTISIKSDCNRAVASYKIEGPTLKISIGPTTLAACPGNSRGEEFLQLLGKAQRFVIASELLIVVLENGASLGFRAPSIVDRCGIDSLALSQIVDTLDPKISDGLDQALKSFVTPGPLSTPGTSMLVITPKGRYFKSAGLADVDACTHLKADSPYQIGSNTKMMTSAIIYQLQEKGRVHTSDLLSKWLPELAAKLPYGKEITIDMLLTHTSGLVDYFDVDPGDGGISIGMKDRKILTQGFTPGELVMRVANSGRSEFKPGEAGKWKYCNTGYILLGLIIEKATGKSYEENLRTRIFGPLKLRKTYLQMGQPVPGAIPVAYYESPFLYTTNEWNASQGWSAGAVVSTSEEFAVFLKALFTGKLFKKKTTLDLMTALSESSRNLLGPGTVYGHGILNNHGILGHGGETLGFQSDGGYIPGKDVTIVFWSNSASNKVGRSVVPALAKIALGEN